MLASLVIAIPTYNRADKLARLLDALHAELTDAPLRSRVSILVSDNASTDRTRSVAEAIAGGSPRLRYHRQDQNVGFDRNVLWLYEHADADYVWFFGDDDLPLPGAVARVLSGIDQASPDFLVSSFVQPPGSTVRQFNFSSPLHSVADPAEAVRIPLAVLKLSVFVLRRRALTERTAGQINQTLDSGWSFVALTYGVLGESTRPTVAVLSEPLATSDQEFAELDWAPVAIPQLHRALENDFVRRHAPEEIARRRLAGYYSAIAFCFSAKVGSLKPRRPEEYDEFFRSIPVRPFWLLRRPKVLVQYLLLAAGLAHLLAPIWPSRRP